jgi:hypothetical protein
VVGGGGGGGLVVGVVGLLLLLLAAALLYILLDARWGWEKKGLGNGVEGKKGAAGRCRGMTMAGEDDDEKEHGLVRV